MKVIITDHAKRRLDERGRKPHIVYAENAWLRGHLLTARESRHFFRKWVYGTAPLADVRKYDGFYFLFQNKMSHVVLITLYKIDDREWDKAMRRKRNKQRKFLWFLDADGVKKKKKIFY